MVPTGLQGGHVTQKVRSLSSGEPEIYSRGSGLLTKHLSRSRRSEANTHLFTVTLLQVVAWHKGWELGN